MAPNAPRGTRHTVATMAPSPAGARIIAGAADDAHVRDVADVLRAMIAERISAESETMATLAERKPTCTDGHSDGVRVRYVRAETVAAVLADVLAALDGIAPAGR